MEKLRMSLLAFFVGLAVIPCIVSARILASPEMSKDEARCDDGRICECKRYLDAGSYIAAKRISDCLTEMGAQHDFSEGANSTIYWDTCYRYRADNIINAELRKCVFRKANLVVTVDGVDMWDLEKLRNIVIDHFMIIFSSQEDAWIRDIIVETFTNCEADEKDFEVVPFEDCLQEVRERVASRVGTSGRGADRGGEPDAEALNGELVTKRQEKIFDLALHNNL